MKLQDLQNHPTALARDMAGTLDALKRFDPTPWRAYGEAAKKKGSLLLTGEGSSRIFPAKRAIAEHRLAGSAARIATEGAMQSSEADLSNWAVLANSNSGKTREVVTLFKRLAASGHDAFFGAASAEGTPVITTARKGHALRCGTEGAVAATMSVIEQAVGVGVTCAAMAGTPEPDSAATARAIQASLEATVPDELAARVASAGRIYLAGRNDGVAEELALKANEITRKAAFFLEGTYLLHGIEETMQAGECVILVEPWESEEEKIEECLAKGVGVQVVAVASRPTRFPTLVIPKHAGLLEYQLLVAGWMLLLAAGLKLDIDLDKPNRARKVGNSI